ADVRGTEIRTNKLDQIIIPKLEFRDATVAEALDFLKQKSRELDPAPDPSKRGVNIVPEFDTSPSSTSVADAAALAVPGLETAPVAAVAQPPTGPASPADARITLSLKDVPLREALNYVTNLANLKTKETDDGMKIVPLTENTEAL